MSRIVIGIPHETHITLKWDNFQRTKKFRNMGLLCDMHGLLTKYEVTMAGYWPSSFFCQFMNWGGVEICKLPTTSRVSESFRKQNRAWLACQCVWMGRKRVWGFALDIPDPWFPRLGNHDSLPRRRSKACHAFLPVRGRLQSWLYVQHFTDPPSLHGKHLFVLEICLKFFCLCTSIVHWLTFFCHRLIIQQLGLPVNGNSGKYVWVHVQRA